MTAEGLVKTFFAAESCELFDKDRINNVIKNFERGYGKALVGQTHLMVTYTMSKTKKMTYRIPLSLISDEQRQKIV